MNETSPTSMSSLNGIPLEVSKIIEQDLAKNPLTSGAERMYRVVINRNLTSPTEDAQVVRVIVKSQGQNQPTLISQPRSQSTVLLQPTQPVIIQPQSPPTATKQPQIHYILPPIEQTERTEPHRYTPPPHKSVILPTSNANSPSRTSSEENPPKKTKKKFSFFG